MAELEKMKKLHIKAGALALIALLGRAGDILVAIDAAEKYATEVIAPIVMTVAALKPVLPAVRFHKKCVRAVLSLFGSTARCAWAT